MISREHLGMLQSLDRLKKSPPVQEVMIIPTAAAVITPKVAQPRYLSSGGFTRFPITFWLLVRRITSRIRGGASSHFCRARATAARPACPWRYYQRLAIIQNGHAGGARL